MDADRFDTLTRSLGAPTSRRAALGATLAGGLLGALGLARTAPQAIAAQGGICTLAFSANVRLGPSLSQPLSAEGQPGALRGNLSFAVDQSGRLTNGELQASSGERFPVVGQATGYSLQARIELAPRVALLVVGVGEQEVAACRGAIDGLLSGPRVGDLGDWHAAAVGAGGGGGGSSSGGSGDTQGSGGTGRGETSAAQEVDPCPAAGEVICDLEEGACVDLATDPRHCGACGNACVPGNELCLGGVCRTELEVNCGVGQVQCGAICCAAGETCIIGECAPIANGGGCADGLIDCGGVCVDPVTDPANCGQCDLICVLPLTCDGGCFCPGDTVNCGDFSIPLCVDPLTDPTNCGLCGIACAAGETCQVGSCTATTTEAPAQPTCADIGLTDCFDFCVDVQTDGDHCGECGAPCGFGECVAGECIETVGPAPAQVGCPDGQADCGGGCIDVIGDPANCGFCGNVCAGDEQCLIGGCVGAIEIPI